jgi:hypothetical protein
VPLALLSARRSGSVVATTEIIFVYLSSLKCFNGLLKNFCDRKCPECEKKDNSKRRSLKDCGKTWSVPVP